ncbi:MAG: signal peptide peptidase SppA [Candidatus Gastranaerophilales bacterium]|nr:signal peptide peptidase SppA [Candidatus Gastranaerophilales bacterium]
MEKKYLAISILAVCVLCLVLGLAKPRPFKTADTGLSAIQAPSRIALINLEGPISSTVSTTFFPELYSATNVLDSVNKAAKDKTVKGVILRINSPGGTVSASQDIYDAVLRLRKEKPVVVSIADVAASGGYYVASAADRIVAQEGSMTGSIGVIFSFIDAADLTRKIGLTDNTVKSGRFKDAGSFYRRMTTDEKSLFQTTIYDAYDQFIDAIDKGRIQRKDTYKAEKTTLTLDTLKQYADGRIFLGSQAKKIGFVDSLGGQYEAENLAKNLVQEKFNIKTELPVVPYNKDSSFKSLLMGIESKFNHNPISSMLPFSVKYAKQPLLLWE